MLEEDAQAEEELRNLFSSIEPEDRPSPPLDILSNDNHQYDDGLKSMKFTGEEIKILKDKGFPFSFVRNKWRQCATRLRKKSQEDIRRLSEDEQDRFYKRIEERVKNICHSKTMELLNSLHPERVHLERIGGKKSKRNKRKNKKTRKSSK